MFQKNEKSEEKEKHISKGKIIFSYYALNKLLCYHETQSSEYTTQISGSWDF